MTKPKKLIEVAMPVKEVSAESVRDKSIRHGHISTLHLWWARRPLPVCRAVVFASIVPDPLDEHCPDQFREAVNMLLGKNNDLPGDPYRPYDDIPHTAIVDKMEDNLRNRLLMFIGKFSDKYVQNEKQGKTTPAKEKLDPFSMIKWDNKNNADIIGRARQLIFVSHNANPHTSSSALLAEYHRLNDEIKRCEQALYTYKNRHIPSLEVDKLEHNKDAAINAFLDKMPKVFDPFAGGGAIPLEAARLGCNSYGNDINPVAHIIQKGSCEFPQKFGKPIIFSKEEFIKLYDENEFIKQQSAGNVFGQKVTIDNRLAHDVEYYASRLLYKVEDRIGHLYPKDKNGNKPIAYYWARVGKCANPSCGAEVPLLKQFYLAKTSKKKVHLVPVINEKKIRFEISSGTTDLEGWNRRGNLSCPCCHQVTPINNIKEQSKQGGLKTSLLAVIMDGANGKTYRIPFETERDIIENSLIDVEPIRPNEHMQRNSAGGDTFGWGVNIWGQLFSIRQLNALQTFVDELRTLKSSLNHDSEEYIKALYTYLGIWIDRIAIANTSFGIWHVGRETLERIMGRQAIPMVFDFPESNPFCSKTGSAENQLTWIIRYIKDESSTFHSVMNNASSGEKNQFLEDSIDVVVTDPPYYDAIAYADLSDFFYVWMKRNLSDLYPLNFATPQTPKAEECTALKHHHDHSVDKAFKHFDKKLLAIFDAIEYQTKDIVSIMFAHQSTSAWTTLCNSILGANLNLVASWANDTEMTGALKTGKDFLSSSVTVACRPAIKIGIGDFKEVKSLILKVIRTEVVELYALGFRGADLLTACFGKAVSVFGEYEQVEKADGSIVTVAELLEMAREAAFNAIVSDIDTDDLTRFYIGWLNLFGFSEAVHDDVRRISQIGLSIEMNDIYNRHALIKNGDKATLGSMIERIAEDSRLGLRPIHNAEIDIAHRMMFLYDTNHANRPELLDYIASKAPTSESSVWRILNSLAELLPKSKNSNDQKMASGLLNNQDNLLKEAKNRDDGVGTQSQLGFDQ